MSGLLWGRVLRSPHAHARIKSIDVSKALALPGVKAVITGKDMPVNKMDNPGAGLVATSDNLLAREKALYLGHAVAAVAATSPHVAEQALSLIDVDYEVLPPVLNAADAMKDDAPILHERLLTMNSPAMRSGGWGDVAAGKQSNVANRFEFRMGDVDKGFQEADVVLEHS